MSERPSLDQITHIARRAGDLLRERFGDPGLVESKGEVEDKDVVTEVDMLAEQIVLEGIRAADPAACVLSEEAGWCQTPGGRARPESLAELDNLWVVDPLDGTINFANSLPCFSVSIAHFSNGRPRLGAIYDPLLDEMFSFDGAGAYLNDKLIRVSAKQRYDESVIAIGSGNPFPTAVADARVWRRLGSAALSLAYVAAGRLEAYIQFGNLAPWDVAAGAPMVLAAGGVVTEPDGQPWPYPLEHHIGIVAANPAIHAEVLARSAAR